MPSPNTVMTYAFPAVCLFGIACAIKYLLGL